MPRIFNIIIVFLISCLPLSVAMAADMPQEGTKAPAFTLPNQEGTEVSLKQYLGKWVVLYFYPKDFTSGCSIEAHNFESDIQKYKKLNAIVLGVSVDTVDSHKSFCAKDGLNFTLLSDGLHTVSETYGSIMDYMGYRLSERNTFLIDPKGVIRKVYAKVNPSTHSHDVLDDLEKLQPKKPAKK